MKKYYMVRSLRVLIGLFLGMSKLNCVELVCAWLRAPFDSESLIFCSPLATAHSSTHGLGHSSQYMPLSVRLRFERHQNALDGFSRQPARVHCRSAYSLDALPEAPPQSWSWSWSLLTSHYTISCICCRIINRLGTQPGTLNWVLCTVMH